MDASALQSLGLTQNESKVYTALAALKSASAAELSKASGVIRVNVYDVIESLKDRGLVSLVKKSNKQYYDAAHPKALLELHRKRQQSLQEGMKAVEKLSLLFEQPTVKQDVGLFKGKLGLKTVLKEVLDAKTEILNFGSGGLFPKSYPEYFSIWEARRTKRKILMRIVASEKLKGTIPKKRLQTIRYLDLEFKNQTSTFIFDDKVAMLMWTAEPFAILIENAELAASNRSYFEYLWKKSKK